MKKKHNIAVILLICILILTFCSCGIPDKSHSSGMDGSPNTIYSLEVWTSAGYDVCYLRYPLDYFKCDWDSGKSNYIKLEHPKSDADATALEHLLEYLQTFPKEKVSDGDNERACKITLVYYDENGKKKFLSYQSDSFPDGWSDFINLCNELSGEDVLTSATSKQTLSPKLLSQRFNITDDDIKNGTLQELIDTLGLTYYQITTPLFHLDEIIEEFYYTRAKDELAPYCSTEIKEVDSTEEEYRTFITGYLEAINGKIVSDSAEIHDGDAVKISWETGSATILQSKYLSQQSLDKDGTGEAYYIQSDVGPESMVLREEFYYSSDFKYVITDPESFSVLSEFIWGKDVSEGH